MAESQSDTTGKAGRIARPRLPDSVCTPEPCSRPLLPWKRSTPGPEVLAREVLLSPTELPCNLDRAFPLEVNLRAEPGAYLYELDARLASFLARYRHARAQRRTADDYFVTNVQAPPLPDEAIRRIRGGSTKYYAVALLNS